MNIKKVAKLFANGSVCAIGKKRRGKDMLIGNVIARRKLDYISNVDYGGKYHPFKREDISCGGNTYKDFLEGKVKYYKYPYPDKTDIYLSDVGIYFPSQYCNELNRDYKEIPVFCAISSHVGNCWVHFNVQALNRAWDKLREQSDTYILCRGCKVFFGKLVIQKIRIYDKYESALSAQPPFRVPLPLFANKEMKLHAKIEKERYYCQHGTIKSGTLIYINKSNYDTRIFKAILEKGEKTK